jgi:hypothetical protein
MTLQNFSYYLLKNIPTYFHSKAFQTSFNLATSARSDMHYGVFRGGTASVVRFSLYVSDILTPSLHVVLLLYKDDTVLVAAALSPSTFLTYLETCLCTDYCTRARRSFLLGPQDAFKSSHRSRFSWAVRRVEAARICGWPLKRSWPGLRTSTGMEKRQLKDWACVGPSLWEALCPSGEVFHFTCNSSPL